MVWNHFFAIVGLCRFSTCLILFLAILIPLYWHLGDLNFAIIHAIPVLTTCMKGFAINDISDIEADKVNHPDRPLPSGQLSEFFAIIIYYGLLAFTLIYIKILINIDFVFGYLLFLIGLINYNYVIRHTPKFKNLYIALVGTIPFMIIWDILPNFDHRLPVIFSLFLFVFGREILMDVCDLQGDGNTLAKFIGENFAQYLGFGAQFLALIMLLISSIHWVHYLISICMIALSLFTVTKWHRGTPKKALINYMRIQFLCGIVLLLN